MMTAAHPPVRNLKVLSYFLGAWPQKTKRYLCAGVPGFCLGALSLSLSPTPALMLFSSYFSLSLFSLYFLLTLTVSPFAYMNTVFFLIRSAQSPPWLSLSAGCAWLCLFHTRVY
ncbi:hypothetical protein B0T21DRAFT_363779 [Apiosordaria backusii]|uniref:Uncharacterized protein n=1 Tax=Apiosordaria backusii TaxID=314023 RepID=A0AA40ECX3_9PEZI|nr:hypothetical protein B0T21DRAFT_363779 [Apiosordaria backusii]